jgi:hypothetical protein
MCRSPLAYGHATATRIFLGDVEVDNGANDRESPPRQSSSAEATRARHQRDDDKRDDELPRVP